MTETDKAIEYLTEAIAQQEALLSRCKEAGNELATIVTSLSHLQMCAMLGMFKCLIKEIRK